jgi:hypothetical protein
MLFVEVLETGESTQTAGRARVPQKSFPNTPTRGSMVGDNMFCDVCEHVLMYTWQYGVCAVCVLCVSVCLPYSAQVLLPCV